MSEQYIIQEETLTDIADAIRSVEGSSEEIQVSQMASRISNLSGAGGVSNAANAIRCKAFGTNIEIDENEISTLPHYLDISVRSKNLWNIEKVTFNGSIEANMWDGFTFHRGSSTAIEEVTFPCNIIGGRNVIFSATTVSATLKVVDSKGNTLATSSAGEAQCSFYTAKDLENVSFKIVFPVDCETEDVSKIQIEYAEEKTTFDYYTTTTTAFDLDYALLTSIKKNCEVEISNNVIELTQTNVAGGKDGTSKYLFDRNFINRKVKFSVEEFTCSSETAIPCIEILLSNRESQKSYYLTSDNLSETIEFDGEYEDLTISLLLDKNSASEAGTIATFKNFAIEIQGVIVTINDVNYQVTAGGQIVSENSIIAQIPTTATIDNIGLEIEIVYSHDTKSYIDNAKGQNTLTEDDKEEISSKIKDEVENQLDGAKADIVTELITQIGGMPVFGTVSDDNTITLTSMLADGVYSMVYENEEGIIEEITSFTVGNGDKPNVNEYEVDVAKVGYTDNARWSITDGTIRTGATGYTTINKISFERISGQTVTINLSGITWTDSALETQYASILLYVDDLYTTGNNLYLKELPKDFTDVGVRANLNEDNSITITIYDGLNETMFNGFKLCGVGSGANAKITITIG